MRLALALGACLGTLALGAHPAPAEGGAQRLTPAAIDALIDARIAEEGLTPSATCSDADFIRRVSLDLTGTLPSLDATRAFLADPAPGKRAALVDRLLASPAFAAHWTDLWELVWLDRKTRAERSNRPQFRAWLEQQLAGSARLDTIVRDMLLATGDQREVGQVGYIIRYGGKAGDVAGAASRHFLGVQIQCAQCHDHPYEAWKTTDFRDFAAFFGRTQMLAVSEPDPKEPGRNKRVSWSVAEIEPGSKGYGAMRGMGGMDDAPDGEGDELSPREQRRADARKRAMQKRLENMKAKNPERAEQLQWALAAPRALGESEPIAVGERTRRDAFADWLTGPGRPRFARATANRIWAWLFGRGIVDPVDDLSSQHPPTHPELLDRLGQELSDAQFALRDFLRLCMATRAYQRSSAASVDNAGDTEWYARAYVRQLSPEQTFASLFQASTAGDPADLDRRRRQFILRARAEFIEDLVVDLGNDDGDTVDGFQGSIPAALALLNGTLSNAGQGDEGAARAAKQRARGRRATTKPETTVGRVLAEHSAPADRVRALYLAALVRTPSEAELERCVAFLESAATPEEGCQDLLWTLFNSTEFLVVR